MQRITRCVCAIAYEVTFSWKDCFLWAVYLSKNVAHVVPIVEKPMIITEITKR